MFNIFLIKKINNVNYAAKYFMSQIFSIFSN